MSVPLSEFMGSSMSKVREMADVNTIVGDPIKTDDGVTIIPVSKVSIGFGGGASDLPGKTPASAYGGGAGAGVTLTPVAFLIVKDGGVRVLPVAEPATTSVDRLIELIPDLMEKISAFLQAHQKPETAEN
ncbi:MAG: GerW family sporulation protein [Oscillospiraceae bacterium]|nr:GerW family sporulation protein [Oscillospiraceae bacterium]